MYRNTARRKLQLEPSVVIYCRGFVIFVSEQNGDNYKTIENAGDLYYFLYFVCWPFSCRMSSPHDKYMYSINMAFCP